MRGPGRAAPPSAAATDNISCRREAVWFQLIKHKVPSLCWDPQITHILSHLYFSSWTVEEKPHTVHYPPKPLCADLQSGCATFSRCVLSMMSHREDSRERLYCNKQLSANRSSKDKTFLVTGETVHCWNVSIANISFISEATEK